MTSEYIYIFLNKWFYRRYIWKYLSAERLLTCKCTLVIKLQLITTTRQGGHNGA